MSKVNHYNNKVSKRFTAAPADFCCGKRGERRNEAGKKKFHHSRNRFRVKQAMIHVDVEVDLSEIKWDDAFDKRVKDPSKGSGSITRINENAKSNDDFVSQYHGIAYHYTKNSIQ